MTKFFSAIFFLLLTHQGSTQDYKRTVNWYFGNGAGIYFKTSPPTATTGSLWTDEGCASISDDNGNLLFYTNGQTVYNKNHQVMTDGNGLKSSPSSIQAAIIIPQPDNDSLYYIFTTYGGYVQGLQYTIVNIKSDGGLGRVILKNQQLVSPICESLSATFHQNGNDVWVVTKGFKNNNFYAYLVTKNGLITCPVVTTIGSINGVDDVIDFQSSLKFSNDGTKCVSGIHDLTKSELEILDFDNSTGRFSNVLNISANTTELTANSPYAFEFSHNKRFLYYTNWENYLCRYDLSLKHRDSISAKRDTLYSPPNGNWLLARPRGIQYTPDNRILVVVDDSNYLSSIEYPDSINCVYVERSIDLGNKISTGGLPNFISNYFERPRIEFGYRRDCLSDTFRFNSNDTLNRNSWRFKRLSDNTTLTSSVQNPVQRFTDTGHYEVRLIIGVDTVTKIIYSSVPMQVDFDLGKDTSLCDGDSLVLQPSFGSGYFCYQWQNYSTAPAFTAKQTGLYVVTATNNDFCQVQDSIYINFIKPLKPLITRIGDTLFASQGDYLKYQWYKDGQHITSDTLRYTVRTSDGNYKVHVTSPQGCSTFSETYNTTNIIEQIKSDIKVYPNPTSGALHIELPYAGQESIQTVRLINTIGQPVYTKSYSGRGSNTVTLQCKELSNGLYTLELTANTQTYLTRITIIQ